MDRSVVHRKSADVLYMWSYLGPTKQQWYYYGRSSVQNTGVEQLHITYRRASREA